MEDLFKAETVAIIAVVYAAASEIIGVMKIDSNSNVQLVMNIIKRLFGLKNG